MTCLVLVTVVTVLSLEGFGGYFWVVHVAPLTFGNVCSGIVAEIGLGFFWLYKLPLVAEMSTTTINFRLGAIFD